MGEELSSTAHEGAYPHEEMALDFQWITLILEAFSFKLTRIGACDTFVSQWQRQL
jgi:hypothetical protein